MIMIWGEKVVSKERRLKTGRQSYEHFPPRGRHTRTREQMSNCNCVQVGMRKKRT